MQASSQNGSKAVFLDRDGTIAEDVNFCCSVEDFKILPSAPEALILLVQHGYKIFVVTNQSGVAREYLSEADLQQINDYMESELAKYGTRLDGIYCCVHGPDDDCNCRKPKPGLLLAAAAENGINLGESYMVGDSARDIEAGKAAGCRTVLLTTGPEPCREISPNPDFIADSLLQAANWITGTSH